MCESFLILAVRFFGNFKMTEQCQPFKVLFHVE